MAIEKKEVGVHEVAYHTTLTREIHPIANWHEWLARWQSAQSYHEMIGLLHVGFDVTLEHMEYEEKKYDQIDRFIFYFIIAEGWMDEDLLRLPEDGEVRYLIGYNDANRNRVEKRLSELRQLVARKAFEMLCSQFFKIELKGSRGEGHFRYEWEHVTTSERLFPIIQNFFRIEKKISSEDFTIPNLNLSRWKEERSHHDEVVEAFLLNLTQFLWHWKGAETLYLNPTQKAEVEKCSANTQARLDAAKPWMIEILAELKKLDRLKSKLQVLDELCVAKLTEIALRSKLVTYRQHPVREDRLVRTIEEACYVGSPAAWLLKEHELKMSEHKRLQEVLDAEQAFENAQERLRVASKK